MTAIWYVILMLVVIAICWAIHRFVLRINIVLGDDGLYRIHQGGSGWYNEATENMPVPLWMFYRECATTYASIEEAKARYAKSEALYDACKKSFHILKDKVMGKIDD